MGILFKMNLQVGERLKRSRLAFLSVSTSAWIGLVEDLSGEAMDGWVALSAGMKDGNSGTGKRHGGAAAYHFNLYCGFNCVVALDDVEVDMMTLWSGGSETAQPRAPTRALPALETHSNNFTRGCCPFLPLLVQLTAPPGGWSMICSLSGRKTAALKEY